MQRSCLCVDGGLEVGAGWGNSRVSEENKKVVVDGGVGCLGERSVDRFQAWYFPDRLNGKGQRSAAFVSLWKRGCVCIFELMCTSKCHACLLYIELKELFFCCFGGIFFIFFLFQVFGFRSPIKLKPQNKCKDLSVCVAVWAHVCMWACLTELFPHIF